MKFSDFGFRLSDARRLCLALLLLAGPSWAAVEDVAAFARLPVLEGGRVMPMDTYARLRLLQLSGRSTHDKQPAVEWLARLLFAPQTSHDEPVLLVNHPEVLEAMGVEAADKRRFSFNELQPGLETLRGLAEAAAQHPENDRNPVEKEILRLYQSLTTYLSLRYSFQFAQPHADFAVSNAAVRARLGVADDAGALSFLDVYNRAHEFSQDVQSMANTDPAQWSEEQTELFRLSSALFQWSQFYRELPIPMLPLHAHGGEEWVSPWDLIAFGFQDDVARKDVEGLQQLARAYAEGKSLEFDLAAHTIERSVLSRAPESRSLRHLDLELLYNRVDAFYRAQIFYGLAFLVCLLGLMTGNRFLSRAALWGVVLALIPHTLGIVWRMMIMGRPPMTNLYATFLFVSWMCVVLGLFVEWLQRNSLGTLLCSSAGLILLLVAGRFSSQGDTLGVVVAVLDSNFWLATHVVTITMGYAGCFAAGLVGHLYLLQALRKPLHDASLQSIARAIYGLLAFGLIFSFLGTMLGGVWADQSWGRFWGWDPKENGALLIVLWCAILFHARIAGMVGPLGVAAGSVLGVIVVLMAWLGINLLGVGLHSYGFTSGLARGLWTSVAFEVSFVGITLWLILRRARA